MTERIVIRKSETTPPFIPGEPLTWMPVDPTTGFYKAWVVCVNGHASGLPDHDIDAGGNVSPSILCRTLMGPDAAKDSNYYSAVEKECGWHVFARLEGWGKPG